MTTLDLLVLAASPDVMTHLDLLRAQPRPGQQLVEAVYGGVNDIRHLEGELHLPGQDLISFSRLRMRRKHSINTILI